MTVLFFGSFVGASTCVQLSRFDEAIKWCNKGLAVSLTWIVDFFIVYYFSYLTTVQSTITSTCRLRNSIIIVVTESTEHMTKQPFYSQHSFLGWQKFNFFRKDEIEIPRELRFWPWLDLYIKMNPHSFYLLSTVIWIFICHCSDYFGVA